MANDVQLRLIREIVDVFGGAGIDFWLRGGWALDSHLGEVTREHEDVELVAWLTDNARIRALLEPLGYVHVPRPNDRPEIGLRLEHDGEEVGFVFLVRTPQATLVTRGYEGWPWPQGMLDDRPRSLRGVTSRVLTVQALLDETETYAEWSGREPRSKDVASLALLRRLV